MAIWTCILFKCAFAHPLKSPRTKRETIDVINIQTLLCEIAVSAQQINSIVTVYNEWWTFSCDQFVHTSSASFFKIK